MFQNREFSFTLKDDVYVRYQSFSDLADLKQGVPEEETVSVSVFAWLITLHLSLSCVCVCVLGFISASLPCLPSLLILLLLPCCALVFVAIQAKCPYKIDIGAVYTAKVPVPNHHVLCMRLKSTQSHSAT